MSDGGGIAALAVVAVMILIMAGCWLQRCGNSSISLAEMRVPLVVRANNRVQLAIGDADAGFYRCGTCAFENFKRAPFCSLCGAEIDTRAEVQYSYFMQALHADGTRAVYMSRQQRARNRKEWLRKVDAEGKLYWFRQRREHSAGAPRLAGYVLMFTEPETGRDSFSAALMAAPATRVSVDANAVESPSTAKAAPLPRAECAVFPPEQELSASQPSRDSAVQQPPLLAIEAVTMQLAVEAASSSHVLEGSWDADPARFAVASSDQPDLKLALAMAARDFPTKFAHFVVATASLLVPPEREVVTLNISRDRLLAHSVEALSVIPRTHIRSSFRVHFVGERGVDAGGIYREWSVLLHQRFVGGDANASSSSAGNTTTAVVAGVFRCVDPSEQTFYVNANSLCDIGDDHLLHFFAAGRQLGRALLEGQTLGFHLALPLLKLMIGQPVSFNDLEYFDPPAYQSMLWILSNSVDALDLTFTIMEPRGRDGDVVEVELIESGSDVRVTDENKELYLQRRFQYLLFESVSSQLYVFLKGLYEVTPQELLMLFDPEEFDYVLSGSDEIDVDDWQKHTRVGGSLNTSHEVVTWFWDIVRAMPNEYRRRLLHFATGSSRVPIAGFSALTSVDGRLFRFTLKGVPLDENEYIASHACFNQLDVPLYNSQTKLREVLYATLEIDVLEGGFTTE